MWKIMMMLLMLSFLVIACQGKETPEAAEESDMYQPIEYKGDTPTERKGKIPTGKDSFFKRSTDEEFRDSKFGETNKSHDNDYNNEDSMEITARVNEIDEVTMTQAFSTDDEVFIAVMINPYDRRHDDIPKKIREKVDDITNKKITIYTNNNNWDRMKNLNSRLKASQAPDDLKTRIKDFFNQGSSNK